MVRKLQRRQPNLQLPASKNLLALGLALRMEISLVHREQASEVQQNLVPYTKLTLHKFGGASR